MGSSLVRGGKLEVLGSGFWVQMFRATKFRGFRTTMSVEPRGGQAQKLRTYPDKTLNGAP